MSLLLTLRLTGGAKMIDFAYEMLGIALRAVGVFAFWGGLICLLWGVATLCRVVVQLVKRYM